MDQLCAICKGIGWLRHDVPYGHPNFAQIFPCECTEHVQQVRVQVHHQTYIDALQSKLGILSRCTFATFEVDRTDLQGFVWQQKYIHIDEQRKALRRALDFCCRYANSQLPKPWLYICGPVGAGKSHLAAAMLNALAAQGRKVVYATSAEHLDYIRAGIADNTADARFNALCNIDVLAIDDLGMEASTLWEQERLSTLINYRWRMHSMTIITSNARVDAHEARIADRICERAEVVLLPVWSYRRRKRS